MDPIGINDDKGIFRVPDLFLNASETYEYQIIRPSYISETDNLVSVDLQPRDDAGGWLTVNNQGVLQGTADFGNEHREQRYDLTLNYESGSSVETNFNVFTNSYVETNEWGHDYNYNLNYYYNPYQVYASQNLSVNILKGRCKRII